MHTSVSRLSMDRLAQIQRARDVVLAPGQAEPAGLLQGWIERSWLRCLAHGQSPGQTVQFETVSAAAVHRVLDLNHGLLAAARPVMAHLSETMRSTRYFAMLTDAQGVVVDVNGPLDPTDRRARAIARVGVDLSERAVGTTAIGAALFEQQAVWLHRGEHFFADNGIFSCAGAPVFGPGGDCVGMLDLTGVEALERPELRHLVTQAARRIENALALAQPHHVLLRLNWPGLALGEEGDGLLTLNREGRVTAMNPAAHQMLGQSQRSCGDKGLHCDDLFALPAALLFDAAHRQSPVIDAPLWSGLRLRVLARERDDALSREPPYADRQTPPAGALRSVEASLIWRAVDQARGNVSEAARALGISRATVYRKISRPRH